MQIRRNTLTTIQVILSIGGGFLGQFFGGFDMLMMTLVSFVIMDYLTGVMQAIVHHKLCSKVGFKGIFKKILIFFIVGIAVSLDGTFGTTNLRYIAIVFYIVNEGISIIENAIDLGLPIPDKIKAVLDKLNEENDGK